jgi:selenocysteine lyase/cysteine desulfurase
MAQRVEPARYRDEFPVAQEWSYLNHASLGPLPLRTANAARHSLDESLMGAVMVSERDRIPGEAAGMVAALAGGRPEMVAWSHSLADAMNLLGWGLRAKAGDNILIPWDEHPSVVYPFLNLTRQGIELRYVEKDTEGRTDLSRIEAAMDERTRAVAISHVEYMDGFRNDYRALGALCRSRNIELFLDATQSMGVQPIEVDGSGVTAVTAHAFKWLLAGMGIAPIVFGDDGLDRIAVTYAGRLGVKGEFKENGLELDWRDTAERFRTGGQNMLSLTALHASLTLVNDVGPANSSAHTTWLLDKLIDGLQQAGYQIVSDLRPEHRSQILTFTSGDMSADDDISRELNRAHVSITRRGRGLRVSPYFYNTPDDIDRLLEALPPR